MAISNKTKKWLNSWARIAADIERIVKQGLSAGKTVERAVDIAVKESRLRDRLEGAILSDVIAALVAGRGKLAFGAKVTMPRVREWYLHRHWDGEGLSLSKRINRLEMVGILKRDMRRSMRAKHDWIKAARTIKNDRLVKGDVAGHIWDVIKKARLANAGDPKAAAAYERAVRRSQAQIERLARDGAPTSALKKAYANVIKATETGSKIALDKAIGRAVNNKMRYNAERIVRTERARAYSEGVLERVHYGQDEDIINALRYELSSRHPMPDQCDMHAGADMFGMGAGIYPKDKAPIPPVHPHCTCRLAPVYGIKKAKKTFVPSGGKRWLEKHPALRKSILGASGGKSFAKNPDGWRKQVRGWVSPQSTKPQMPKAIAK